MTALSDPGSGYVQSNVVTSKDDSPQLSLREEAIEIVTEWRDELAAAQETTPSEARVAEIYLVNQILSLLAPTASHYQM